MEDPKPTTPPDSSADKPAGIGGAAGRPETALTGVEGGSLSRSAEPAPAAPIKPANTSWERMRAKADSASGVVVSVLVLLAAGGIAGFIVASLRQPATTKPTTVQSLSADEIKKLTDTGTSLGTSGQTLSIGADALLRGKVDVGGDLSVGGHFNANGPVTLSQLNISGTTALTGLNVGSNLNVDGLATLQKGANVQGLLAVNGGLNVSGTASINALNVSTISVRNLSISGPLTVGHLATQGPPPSATAGTAVGGGGTISISGNDTAGTINVNTGGGPPAGILATVVFRAAYAGGVHVLITPLTGASATLPAYVTRTATGFQLRVDTPPPAGTVYAFDYLVTQ